MFVGSCVALVTPFNKNGSVNYFSLKNLIDYQIASGTKAILILGTTGEVSTITEEERVKIIKFCVCLTRKKVPLIVGCGSNSTTEAIKKCKQAESLGADGVLIVTPYYNKCNQKGLYFHYQKIANSIMVPVIIYNVPSRTGVNILPETVFKLSKIKNIVGIKEASGNIGQMAELCHILPKSFSVFCGDDNLTLCSLSLGAKGVISVTANCYPEEVQRLCEFGFNQDYVNARRTHEMLFDINKAMFLDVNPICVKAYLNLMGFEAGSVRLPLTDAEPQIIKKLKEVKTNYEN